MKFNVGESKLEYEEEKLIKNENSHGWFKQYSKGSVYSP